MSGENLEVLRREFEEKKSRRAYIPYADALRRCKQLQKALVVCLEGLNEDEGSLTGRSLLARIYYDMGRYEASSKELEIILEREPNALQSRALLVRSLLRQRKIGKAESQWNQLVKLAPNDDRIRSLGQDIMRIRTRLRHSTGAGHHSSSGPPSTLQAKAYQIRKSLSKSPFIELIGLLSEMGPEVDGVHVKPLLEMVQGLSKPVGEAGWGVLRCMHIELEGALGLVYHLEEDYLVILARPECKIGRLRYQIEKALMG